MMARQRDYHAEEVRRNELAQERGFSNRAEERAYRSETKFEREIAGQDETWQQKFGTDWQHANPRQLASYYENVLEPQLDGREVTGLDKHNAVAYYIEFEGMTEDEAVAAMKEAFGYE
jgi:hypothetical protein